MYRPPRFNDLGAHVSGVSAWVISKLVEQKLAVERVPPEYREEVQATADALRAAAIYWEQERDPGRRPQPSAPPPEREPDRSMSTGEAARVLGVSERRVTQLLAAGVLEGRKAGGRWIVNADSVDGYGIAREVA